MVIEFLRIVYSDALYIREYHAVEIFYAQIKLIKSLIRTNIDPIDFASSLTHGVNVLCQHPYECYRSRSHTHYNLSATHGLTRPTPNLLITLNRFKSRLKIKISKLLSLRLQIKQIRVVFTHLKLWVKVVRHNSKCVKI